MEKPKLLSYDKMDIDALRDICQDYIDFIDNDEEYHEDNKFKSYIFEIAVELIFGKDIWEFINNRQQ